MIPYRKRALEERYRVHWGHLETPRSGFGWLASGVAALSVSAAGALLILWL